MSDVRNFGAAYRRNEMRKVVRDGIPVLYVACDIGAGGRNGIQVSRRGLPDKSRGEWRARVGHTLGI